MLEIKNTHTDKNGRVYNIKNYNCEQVHDINEVLGKIITESHYTPENTYYENGIYLFHSNIDSNKAFRIYKDYNLHKYTNHDDDILIEKLQEKQKDIKLTEFPTGIITVGNSVIGQEIIYYENHNSIGSQIKNIKDIKKLLLYYKQILDIMDELLKNKIYYKDLNCGNVIIKDDIIKLIDFELGFISFDYNYSYNTVIYNLKVLLNLLNKNLKINFDFTKSNSIKDIREEIMIKSKRL